MIKDESRVGELLEALNVVANAKIEIGIIGESGKYKGGATTLDIANIHEYGYSGIDSLGRKQNIPERSFIRATFDKHKKELESKIDKGMEEVMELKLDPMDFLESIGQWGKDKTIEYITSLNSPPLKQSTIKAKGSSKLLLDSGQLRSSIVYRVIV